MQQQLDVDRMIDLLAEKLAQLPLEYTNFNYSTPIGFERGYSSSVSSYSDIRDGSVGFGTWSNAFPTGADSGRYDRNSDTPRTWPSCDTSGANVADPFSFLINSGPPTPSYGNRIVSTNQSNAASFPMTKSDKMEWIAALKPPTPGIGYACRICRSNDHYVQNCPRAPSREEVNTPYQGHNQCYGYFACDRCKREWGSHKSFAEAGEFCRRCGLFVYPQKQYPLEKIPPKKLTKGRRGKCRD